MVRTTVTTKTLAIPTTGTERFTTRVESIPMNTATPAVAQVPTPSTFHKNKSGEKLAESEEDLLEHRTDGTDAFDTLYIGCEKFPQEGISSVNYSGFG